MIVARLRTLRSVGSDAFDETELIYRDLFDTLHYLKALAWFERESESCHHQAMRNSTTEPYNKRWHHAVATGRATTGCNEIALCPRCGVTNALGSGITDSAGSLVGLVKSGC